MDLINTHTHEKLGFSQLDFLVDRKRSHALEGQTILPAIRQWLTMSDRL